MPRPQGAEPGGTNTSPGHVPGIPNVFIEPLGDTISLNNPQQGLNTTGYDLPIQLKYTEEGDPEDDTANFNTVIWTIESLFGLGEIYRDERIAPENIANQGSTAAQFILPGGVRGLNIPEIEEWYSTSGINTQEGVYPVKITCTPGRYDENSDTVQYTEPANFLLDLSYGIAGNKTTEDLDIEEPVEIIPLPPGTPNYASFKATILGKSTKNNTTTFNIDESWNDFKSQLPDTTIESPGIYPGSTFLNYVVSYKSNDRQDLNTYLHFGGNKIYLTTNVVTDAVKYPISPHSALFKMYEPLPIQVSEKDKVHIVREILPMLTETVELVSYDTEDNVNDVRDVAVLRSMDTLP